MKKTISILSLILLPLSVMTADIGVLDSGINWTASKLTVTEFKDVDGVEQISGFECFSAVDYTPVDLINLFQAAQNDSVGGMGDEENSNTTCETAGDYTFTIELVDMAENSTIKTGYQLQVFPSDADHVVLNYNNCDGGSTGLIADGSESCAMDVIVEDIYNNKFANFNDGSGSRSEDSSISLKVDGQPATDRTTFDYFTDIPEDLFRDGLEATNSTLDLAGEAILSITAKAPSIDVIDGEEDNAKVSFFTSKSVNLDFKFQEVDDDGTLKANTISLLNLVPAAFKFYPWVKTIISDKDTGLDNLEIDGDVGEEINVTAETGFLGTNLPNGLESKLLGLPPEAVTMKLGVAADFDTLTEGDDLSIGSTLDFSGATGHASLDEDSIFLKLKKAPGISEILDWGLTTQISHRVPNGQPADIITYPGGNFGRSAFWRKKIVNADYYTLDCLYCDAGDVEGSITFIGADIEGQVQSSQDIFGLGQKSGQGHIVSIGGVSAKDAREKISQSAYALYRGSTPLGTGAEDLSLSGIDFTEEVSPGELKYPTGVAYFKDKTVTLGGNIEGKGTIIIVDGNLDIKSDMTYVNPATDSLGIILVNTKAEAPASNKILETGNIFIRSDVQKMVGTYFADGSLLSTDVDPLLPINPSGYIYPNTANLNKQLLLNGTFFTYNTLGGSAVDGSYSTPWKSTAVDLAEATKYDIHYIRRYGGGAANCVSKGTGCDANPFAFIIRPDGKVKNITPPGFEKAAVSYRE